MDLNQLNWNGFPDGKLPKGFVAYELEGILKSDDGVVVVDMNYAVEYGLYGRGRDGLAVSLHDTECLDEAQARLMLLTSTLDTPSSYWELNGDEDPHADDYHCKRKDLALGHLTDDQLANAVFIHNHRELNFHAILAGEPSSIGLLTAAKERIRWLSRQLNRATMPYGELYWNERHDGKLPDDQKWKDFKITGFFEGQEVEVENAEKYRIDGVTSTVTYHLHTTRSYGAALARVRALEALTLQ